MAEVISEVTKIRRRVLTEVAALMFNNRLVEEVENLPKKLTDEGLTSYRCCQYKEQAILQERIKLAMGIDITAEDSKRRLEELAKDVLDKPVERSDKKPYITLIEEACDHCSIDKMFVTNACRNCVAHNCVNSCPRDAIKIVDNRAFIIREKCIECGLCAKACPYGAIVEIERPCSRACAVDAVVSGDKASAAIEYENCVECGACIVACPFGAISYRSEIVNVIKMLSDSQTETAALVAPSFIGQFGPGVDWDVLKEGLKKLGFTRVVMVAAGADEVIREEGRELLENIEFDKGVTFNSCCPSFKNLINKHYPELAVGVSTTESPMLKTARLINELVDDNIKNVFIGPCLAKKGEAVRESDGLINGVLTYEEIAAVLVGAGINLAKLSGENSRRDNDLENPSIDAVNFCAAEGVSKAILNSIERDDLQVKTAEGIKDCDKLLKQISRGILKIDFMEGMGCQDGCIGGPGTMVSSVKANGLLKKLSREVGMNV